jgi:hypothetical protein
MWLESEAAVRPLVYRGRSCGRAASSATACAGSQLRRDDVVSTLWPGVRIAAIDPADSAAAVLTGAATRTRLSVSADADRRFGVRLRSKHSRRAVLTGEPRRCTSRMTGQIHLHDGIVRHVCDRVMPVQVMSVLVPADGGVPAGPRPPAAVVPLAPIATGG